MKYVKQPKRHIYLDDFEWRALVKGISEYRKLTQLKFPEVDITDMFPGWTHPQRICRWQKRYRNVRKNSDQE